MDGNDEAKKILETIQESKAKVVTDPAEMANMLQSRQDELIRMISDRPSPGDNAQIAIKAIDSIHRLSLAIIDFATRELEYARSDRQKGDE